MQDFCTLSPDGFLGVEWSLSCMGHDGRYEKGKTVRDKILADIDLSLDIWAVAALADRTWKTAVIRAYSVLVFTSVSIAGWYYWMKERTK